MSEPSVRAHAITRRSYCRPLNDEETEFETWEQVVDRVVSHQQWLWERAKDDDLDDEELSELEALRHVMYERKATVSGRTLWLGGTEVARTRESSMFNPLPRGQKFITYEGVHSFEDFEDGDQVRVLTHLGNWKDATVSKAGIRDMVDIHLRRGSSTHVVRSCVDHTWILNNGSEVIAKDLSVGDRLYPAPPENLNHWDFESVSVEEQIMWCYGFVFGDGTKTKSGNSRGSMVRLCGRKVEYLSRFKNCNFKYSYPPVCGGEPIVYTGKYQKTLPDQNSEPRLIAAFLKGYLDADGGRTIQRGSVNTTSIQTSDKEAAEFIERWAPRFGLYITRTEDVDRSTNYGRSRGTFIAFTTSTKQFLWKVTDITPVKHKEEAWCLTVEDDHSFVLPNSVVSGNCSFTPLRTVHDVVDMIWLLLQGCGVGFKMEPGVLNGFAQEIPKITVIRSDAQAKTGEDNNTETWDYHTWTIRVGDSAEAWAKAFGKLLAGKYPAKELVFDLRAIRPGGYRLRGYGWISSGDTTLAKALEGIAHIMNRYSGRLLDKMALLDIGNWMGTVLSSRRSAEIALCDFDTEQWEEFSMAKREYWTTGNDQRAQSNNSLMFWHKPTKLELRGLFQMMLDAGGSEPGFVNATHARKRGPWFEGFNPCVEVILGAKSVCNLCEINLPAHNGDLEDLHNTTRLISRANYRQTCVDFRDGILQETWHELNQYLRLTGVGVTGIVMWEHKEDAEKWRELRDLANESVHGMADELGLTRSKLVCLGKPSGTLSKCMDVTEGIHAPLGRYIFNWVVFSKHDPAAKILIDAGYDHMDKPGDLDSYVIKLPYDWGSLDVFTKKTVIRRGHDGSEAEVEVEVNLESAVEQLDRYKLLMENYVDHNFSITVSYDPSEIPEIVNWLYENWDSYVGVSWLLRADPTKSAADLGYPYLPQEVVTAAQYHEYVDRLQPGDLGSGGSMDTPLDDECAGGACPVR